MGNRERAKLILKIETVVKHGFLPNRGYESYKFKFEGTKTEFAEEINCFAHAFFNFNNKQLNQLFVEQNKIQSDLLSEFWRFNLKHSNTAEQNLEPLLDIVRKTGLKVQPCGEKDEVKSNEWKVAVYYDEGAIKNELDFHFLRQEEDGVWTSKNADESRVEQYYELPYVFRKTYFLVGVYKVTNKYAQTNAEVSNEKEK